MKTSAIRFFSGSTSKPGSTLVAPALVVVPVLYCGPQYWHALVKGEKHALHWGHCQPWSAGVGAATSAPHQYVAGCTAQ